MNAVAKKLTLEEKLTRLASLGRVTIGPGRGADGTVLTGKFTVGFEFYGYKGSAPGDTIEQGVDAAIEHCARILRADVDENNKALAALTGGGS